MEQTTDVNDMKSGKIKENELLHQTWECTRCDMEEEEFFKAPLQSGGYLPNCPKCGTNYRVFEVQAS